MTSVGTTSMTIMNRVGIFSDNATMSSTFNE